MMLFEGYFGRILYSGDMRFDKRCETNFRRFAAQYPQLKEQQTRLGIKASFTAINKSSSESDQLTSVKEPADLEPRSGLTWLLEQEEKKSSPASTSAKAVAQTH